jgi:hypothetical protein
MSRYPTLDWFSWNSRRTAKRQNELSCFQTSPSSLSHNSRISKIERNTEMNDMVMEGVVADDASPETGGPGRGRQLWNAARSAFKLVWHLAVWLAGLGLMAGAIYLITRPDSYFAEATEAYVNAYNGETAELSNGQSFTAVKPDDFMLQFRFVMMFGIWLAHGWSGTGYRAVKNWIAVLRLRLRG